MVQLTDFANQGTPVKKRLLQDGSEGATMLAEEGDNERAVSGSTVAQNTTVIKKKNESTAEGTVPPTNGVTGNVVNIAPVVEGTPTAVSVTNNDAYSATNAPPLVPPVACEDVPPVRGYDRNGTTIATEVSTASNTDFTSSTGQWLFSLEAEDSAVGVLEKDDSQDTGLANLESSVARKQATMKCYSMEHLCNFHNNPFIHEHKSEFNRKIYKYGIIIDEIRTCLDNFKNYKIKKHVGIAVDISEHSSESCTLLLGILNYGCHFYCLDFKTTKGFHSYLAASNVEYVISKDITNMEMICSKIYGGLKVLAREYFIGNLRTSPPTHYFSNMNICYTITTSGSTGVPKMIHVPYECIEPNIKSLCSTLEIKENDVIFLGSPPSFDPFVVEFFIALEKGAGLFIPSHAVRLTPNAKLLEDVTVLQTTPSLFRLFGSQLIRDVIFQPKSSLRCLLLGGELFPSPHEIQSWLPDNFQFGSKRIFNIYGITEISCWATIYEYHPSNKYDQIRVPLGKPLDDSTLLRIIDEADGSILPSTGCNKGELLIGSYIRRCLIPQYDKDVNTWNAEDIIYRKSGDIVERDIIGNIYHIGRANNCIKRLGKRVCLDSLANKIEIHLKNKTVCLWDEDNKKLIICLDWNKGAILNKPDIKSLLKENLNDFEQPDQICYTEELPLNKHGKVDRKNLLKEILNSRQRKSPLNILKNFLNDVLGFNDESSPILQKEGVEQKNKRMKCNSDICFTEAGGTSFQALSLATEIGQLLERPEEQRKLLEMLLSSETSLQNVMEFLSNITPVVQEKERELLDHIAEATIGASSIKLLWRSDLKKCVDATPSLFQKTCVAVGSHSHLLLTLDMKTGETISRTELSDRIECPVTFVSSDLAIVGCYDGMLYGFNFNSGAIMWKIKTNGMIKAKPLHMGNLVIVGSYAEDFNIRAFDLETLKCVWHFKLGSKGIFSSPLKVSDNMVLLCSLDGSYALIDSASGSTKWLKKLESPIFSTPAQMKAPNNELILAEVKGNITVCNTDNGEEVAHFQADGNIFSSITICQKKTGQNTLILFGCHDGNVYCLGYDETLTKQISLVWKFSLNSAVYSTPVVAFEDTVLACSTKGLIVLIDVSTAKLKGSYDLKADIFSTPCISGDGYIYVGARDNFLYALEVQ